MENYKMKIKRNFGHSGNKRAKMDMFVKTLYRKNNLKGCSNRNVKVNGKV